jgi:hypothetical protein
MCIRLMLPNETALISSTSDYAYDKFKRWCKNVFSFVLSLVLCFSYC